ncbi:PspA/IM30 family protein [Pseudogracilibacillus sp. SO30301A]|uniref:PspA/IM30 family protein n=1 Tax=Pseudogracilibacillus sp. SO30301A TaxID=3098291 RepID=UPI00300E3604
MSILRRFKDIMASNINALLDKAEDPEKMIDQYLRNLQRDLGQVKAETASIMAEEQRAKRELNECKADVEKMQNYAVKALEAGNEDDARKFLERKATLSEKETQLQTSLDLAEANSLQMRQMHDKLVEDINELNARRTMLKGKAAVAKTQKRMNEISSTVTGANESLSNFDRLEDKINTSLDEANAMRELNRGAEDDMKDLSAKYETKVDVEDELAALKAQIENKEAE